MPHKTQINNIYIYLYSSKNDVAYVRFRMLHENGWIQVDIEATWLSGYRYRSWQWWWWTKKWRKTQVCYHCNVTGKQLQLNFQNIRIQWL